MNDSSPGPVRVPPRLVLASIVGLWATYFLLATLRGVVLQYEFTWDLVARRMVVTLAAMLVTLAIWPVLAVTQHRPFWLRAGLILVLSLPAAMLITAINDRVFAELNHTLSKRGGTEIKDGISIVRDGERSVIEMGDGRLVVRSGGGRTVELGDGTLIIRSGEEKQRAPSPPPPSSPSPPLRPPSPLPPAPLPHADATAPTGKPAPMEKDFWEENADLILGRYFLLLAWAAIYLALASAEQVRAAERRESGYRRAAQAAELRSLRYQINPHFLFNTLNSLSALVLTGKPAAAERMIQTLSTFYRRGLTGDSTGDMRLADEIALQKLYLEIEAVRFPERLRTEIDVPQALDDALVPGMILQPLVENSIKYAVAVSSSPITVRITARAEGERLILSVSDNGPGGAPSDGCGIGLTNVRDRLGARFDGAAGLEAGPLPEGGFRTVIRLPLLRANGRG